MPISTSTKIRQYITSFNSRLYAWRCLQYAWSTCFLICSYTLREDAIKTHWAHHACCVQAVDAQWQLFAPHEYAVSAPWLGSQSLVRTPWERDGTPWVLLGNAIVAVGAPWHLHVMENVKLFTILFSIFVRFHGALRNFKSPCQRSGITVECDRGFTVCCMKLLFVGQHCGLQRSYHFYVQGQSINKTGHSMYTDTRDWGEERIVCLANWWHWNLDMLYWTWVIWMELNWNWNVMQVWMGYWRALSCGSVTLCIELHAVFVVVLHQIW